MVFLSSLLFSPNVSSLCPLFSTFLRHRFSFLVIQTVQIFYFLLHIKKQTKSYLNVYFSDYRCSDWNNVNFFLKEIRKSAFSASFFFFPLLLPFCFWLNTAFYCQLLILNYFLTCIAFLNNSFLYWFTAMFATLI